jgi:hypothetical protein
MPEAHEPIIVSCLEALSDNPNVFDDLRTAEHRSKFRRNPICKNMKRQRFEPATVAVVDWVTACIEEILFELGVGLNFAGLFEEAPKM